ncbi:MAG: response regulator [Chitinophagaceae bacterium]|nr:response regulator [Chitinophagaceae bacterium]
MPDKCNVILTDDDAEDRDFLIMALERNKFNGSLVEADNGVRLFDILDKCQTASKDELPDLLIIDLNMPFMDGFEVLDKLQHDPELEHIPKVVLSSSSKAEDVQICQQLGCDKFYQKPSTLQGYDVIAKDVLTYLKNNNHTC